MGYADQISQLASQAAQALTQAATIAKTADQTISQQAAQITQQTTQISQLSTQVQQAQVALATAKQQLSAAPQLLPDGFDLATITAPGKYIALPGVTLKLTGTWAPKVAGISIVGTGNTPLTVMLPGAATVAIDATNAPGLEISGLAITAPRNCQFIANGQQANYHDCQVVNTIEQFAVVGYPAGNGAKFTNIVALAPTGSRLIYVYGADDVTISKCVGIGSLGEDQIRATPNDDAVPHVPARLTIDSCSLTGKSPQNKASISLRACNVASITNNHLEGWVRLGEAAGTPTALSVTMTGNTHEPEPNAIDQIDAMAATVSINNNTFKVNAAQRSIAIDGGSQLLSCDGNTTVSTDGKPAKKLVITGNKVESDGTNTKHQ